jgi:hypothetical protein
MIVGFGIHRLRDTFFIDAANCSSANPSRFLPASVHVAVMYSYLCVAGCGYLQANGSAIAEVVEYLIPGSAMTDIVVTNSSI